MHRITVNIDPQDDGTIKVEVLTTQEVEPDNSGGSYKIDTVIAPVPTVRAVKAA